MSDTTVLNRYQRALEAVERRGEPNARSDSHPLLTFESAIEADYLDYRRSEGLPLLRFGLLLAVAFYVLFLLADALTWQRYLHAWVLVPTLCIACTANLAMVWLTTRERARPYLDWGSTVTAMVNAVAFAYISATGYRLGVIMPPEVAIIQQVYILFLLNLPFRFAAPVTGTAVGVFALLHGMANMTAEDYFYRCFMMAVAGMVGTLACYLTERTQRLAWLRSRLLRELSEHDSLTGLYNHRVFYQRGDQLLRQARRDHTGVAVLLCDVDHFKKFNDSHGHLAGDDALRHVSAALSQCARRPLDLAARVGGEEFGLLLYNVTPETARARAEEVRNVVRGLSLADDRRITISIGVAFAESGKVAAIEALIGAADSALYRAKDAGRDRVSD